jgi:hypothetical protein
MDQIAKIPIMQYNTHIFKKKCLVKERDAYDIQQYGFHHFLFQVKSALNNVSPKEKESGDRCLYH